MRVWKEFLALFAAGFLGISGGNSFGQIDTTLFGDDLGPAIPDRLETGEDWMVVEESPEVSAVPAPLPEPSLDPTPAPSAIAPTPASPSVEERSVPEAEPEKPKAKRSWLPWKTKRTRREEAEARLEAERAKYGPRMSGLKRRASQGGSGFDSGLMESELRRWKRDPRKAMAQARAERKMLLLWITDSVRSGTSKPMATEVFRHSKFLRLMKDYMVLTKLDFAEPDIAAHKYTKYLKDKLKVMGYPVLVLFSPDSEELWRYVGYRSGRFPEIIDQLGYQAEVFVLKENHRHQQLVSNGYRQWTNYKNEPIFAKALSVSREEKKVVLLDEQGKRYSYPVVKLSKEDRDWLAEKFLR